MALSTRAAMTTAMPSTKTCERIELQLQSNLLSLIGIIEVRGLQFEYKLFFTGISIIGTSSRNLGSDKISATDYLISITLISPTKIITNV